MADTVEELVNTTINASSVDSNQEQTLYTTDANTRVVLKDIQVSTSNNPVAGNITVNGFEIAGIEESTGSEIIGPSSTIKAKATNLPATYLDAVVSHVNGSTLRYENLNAFVSGFEETTLRASSSEDVSAFNNHTTTYLGPHWSRTYKFNNGTEDRYVVIKTDLSNSGSIYVANTSGIIISYTTAGRFVFDGVRYVYWWSSSALYKSDLWLASNLTELTSTYATALIAPTTTAMAYYGWLDMAFDPKTGKQWLVGRSTANSGSVLIANLTDGVYLETLSGQTQVGVFNNVFGTHNTIAGHVTIYDGSIYVSTFPTVTTMSVLKIPISDLPTSSTQTLAALGTMIYTAQTTTDANNGTNIINYTYQSCATYDKYVITAKGGGATSSFFNQIDVTTGEVTYYNGDSSLKNHYYGNLWSKNTAPDSSTISSRTYEFEPTIDIRITGVKSV